MDWLRPSPLRYGSGIRRNDKERIKMDWLLSSPLRYGSGIRRNDKEHLHE
jgi:hypothetical protein